MPFFAIIENFIYIFFPSQLNGFIRLDVTHLVLWPWGWHCFWLILCIFFFILIFWWWRRKRKKYNEKGSYLYRSELSTGATMNFIIKRWQCIMMKRELSQHILARTKLKSRKIKLWAIWLSNFMFQKNDEGINKRDRFYAHGQLIFAVGHRICMLDGWWFLFPSSPSLLFLCSWFLFPSYYRKIALKKFMFRERKIMWKREMKDVKYILNYPCARHNSHVICTYILILFWNHSRWATKSENVRACDTSNKIIMCRLAYFEKC